jgi:hypothetical protein
VSQCSSELKHLEEEVERAREDLLLLDSDSAAAEWKQDQGLLNLSEKLARVRAERVALRQLLPTDEVCVCVCVCCLLLLVSFSHGAAVY